MRRRVACLAVSCLAGCAAGTGAAAPTNAQLAGQRVVWTIDGTTVSTSMRAAIRRGEVGSVILFTRNASTPAGLRRLTGQLQAIPRPRALDAPLLVTVDQEGGLVRRLRWAPPAMSAARMGARLTPAGITAQGAATGRALRDVGVNVDLAPVCDVAAKGGNVFADGRAFGTTVAAASVGCTSFARGLRAGRVAAAAKHFPGFGRARVNTDTAVVRIAAPRATLEREMAPFRDAISAGVPMVMVASAIYPALSARPALLDAGVVGGMLRRDLGFRGVTVTDAIDTPALRPWGGTRGASAAAAAAGMDLIIVSGTEAAARAASRGVVGALGNSRITRAAAMASLARVLDLRRSLAR